ncbi:MULTISPECIES: hypothetical protein [unclassified Pantoea]|uniref:hypothetical protein n=1 Tax=Pantoea TaxID=53335 RepID=UPI002118FF42|nr:MULTISPECIES: hypothetical protein [unclassified Pantoea]
MTVSDKIALWGMIGSWLSGVGTMVAAIFAWKALSGWRLQEKRNDRKALKIALNNYRNLIAVMPDRLVPTPEFSQPALTIQDGMNQVYQAIVILEVNLLHDDLGKKFVELNDVHSKFMQGKAHRGEIAEKVIIFMSAKFLDS